ncbi:MAG TPA: DUF2505 family protein [Acidimicrobiales bacterium]|jgi:hypothetical protein|nr:DUF2505 family protein [Acidimicrobiales bacterium]
MKLELRYDVHGSAAQFWEAFFDPEVTRRLHLEALRSTSVEIEEQSGDVATGFQRTIRYGQRPDAPGPVKKLFGSEVVTTEHGTFDPETGIWSFTLTPATLGEKTDIRGSIELKETERTDSPEGSAETTPATPTVRVIKESDDSAEADGSDHEDPAVDDRAADEDADQEDSGGSSCQEIFRLEAKVKIFGAGPVVERFIEKQARDTQNRAAAFFNRVLDGED